MNEITQHKKDRRKAVLFLALAAALWSTAGLLIKLVDWNPVAISGTRSLISGIVVLLYLRNFRIHWSKPLVFGSIAYSSTVILFVVSNKLTTAANTILLQYTAPVWVAILSGWLLKEKIHRYDWVSIALTLCGMALFFKDSLHAGGMTGNLLAILSGVGLSLVVVCMRLQKDAFPVETVLLGNFLTFFVTLPVILASPMPSGKSIIGLILLGVFQLGFAYILYAKAIPHVTALEAILIPVIEPLLNPLWVFLFAGEKPGFWALCGGSVVILSVTLRSLYANYVTGKNAPSEVSN